MEGDEPCRGVWIVGPILPVLAYDSLDDAIELVREFPKPLALYVFTTSEQTKRRVFAELPFGGGCVNHIMMHLSNPSLPFGGVGDSGTGAYHGRYTFETFSHRKAILDGSRGSEAKVRYQIGKGRLPLRRRVDG